MLCLLGSQPSSQASRAQLNKEASMYTSLYDTPEKVKELFSLGDLYMLGVNIPDEQYIRGIEKT